MSELSDLLRRPCRDADALHAWVHLFCGLDVPRVATCDNHDAPFDYLVAAYFEPASDLIVWAPRGGGKTRLAAVATLLDLLHKPGCRVRILGGSLEQSMKMWQYLLPDLHRLARSRLRKQLSETATFATLHGGGDVGVLTQSQKSVRGLRVQKLRCDEVELFDPDVWEAAQLTTRSQGGVAGCVEALSTLHTPAGLMGRIVDDAKQHGTRVIRWCLLDVLQRCDAERDCETCPLWSDCGGSAKTRQRGFVSIDDAIRMKRRVSLDVWESEMLCKRPGVRGQVLPRFDEALHVRPFDVEAATGVTYSLGIDFGFAAPLAAVWVARRGETLHVVDEYVQPGRTLEEHVVELRARRWPAITHVGCDPAGAARNSHTAASDVAVLRRHGFTVRHRPSRIREGLELIRTRLSPATGEPTLRIDPRCKQLIAAMRGYRYAPLPGGGFSEVPVKDGVHDHVIDALRYNLINASGGAKLVVRRY